MAAGLQCGSTIIKYLLFLFNFVFVLCGIALIVVGAIALKVQGVTAGGYSSALILIIAVGSIIFVVAFYGCCGSIRESHCMLIAFAVFLLTIIVIEVVAVVLIFVNSGDKTVQDTLKDVFDKAIYNNDKTDLEAVSTIQTAFTCCGYQGPSDWTKQATFPQSCCKPEDSKDCSAAKANAQGCKDTVQDFIEKFGKIAGGVGIGIAVVEVLGVWFALALAGSIKSLERGRR